MKTFYKSIEELNETVRIHKRNPELNATDRAVLDVLARYSCKELGKSWLAKSTIAEIVGKSRRTIIRVCNKLERLGIIRQYTRMRKTGDRRQTSNLIVILPAVEPSQKKHDAPKCHRKETTRKSQKKHVTPECHSKETPARNLNNYHLLRNTYFVEKYDKQTFYSRFCHLIKSTLGNVDKNLIYRLYGVYRAHSAPLLRLNAFDRQTVEAIGWTALKNAIMATQRKRIRNLPGYYNGVLDRMLDRLYYETAYGVA